MDIKEIGFIQLSEVQLLMISQTSLTQLHKEKFRLPTSDQNLQPTVHI